MILLYRREKERREKREREREKRENVLVHLFLNHF